MSRVIRYLRVYIGYDIFIIALASEVAYSSGSRTAVFPLRLGFCSLLCLSLMLYTMKSAMRGDVQRYPYGTGRLENVCAIGLGIRIGLHPGRGRAPPGHGYDHGRGHGF